MREIKCSACNNTTKQVRDDVDIEESFICKYCQTDDKGFNEPILRCDSCNKIVTKTTITKLGFCNHCANKRFRPVDVISELELIQIKKLDGAEAFLELFEEVPDEK